MSVEKEKPMPLIFEEVKLVCGCRIDLLVEKELVIEVKSIKALNDVHLTHSLTYMKIGRYNLEKLKNFYVVKLKYEIKRVVNRL